MLLAKVQLLDFEDIEEAFAMEVVTIRTKKVAHSSELISQGTLGSTFFPYLNLKESIE